MEESDFVKISEWKPGELEEWKTIYRNLGYTHEQDFPGEYYFMINPITPRRVRLYYNGRVIEG